MSQETSRSASQARQRSTILPSLPDGASASPRDRGSLALLALSTLFSVLWCSVPTNVLGGELRCCCRDPLTGFYRDGYCRTGPGDFGLHTVCAQMTNEFLEFSYARGNDLVTPQPGFPGLKEGDRWCLCVTRWHEALEAGVAPPVDLHATHASTLDVSGFLAPKGRQDQAHGFKPGLTILFGMRPESGARVYC